MNAGRTLDEQIHTHVMGNSVSDGRSWAVPRYSTEIAEAWRVVDHLLANGAPHVHVWYDRQVWKCRVDLPEGQGWYTQPANTAPEAICLAALRATRQDAA